MKLRFKYLGIGLFIAGLLIALVEKLDLPSNAENTQLSSTEKKYRDYEHKISELEAQISVLQLADKAVNNGSKEKEENETTTNKGSTKESNKSSSGTLYIYEGVSIPLISQQVEELGIVSNGAELELFLSKPEYSRSIQKGVFELTSDMTMEQIANTLTGKN